MKLCKLEQSYLICKLIVMYCIVGLRTSLLLSILPCICPIFFLSILWMIKIFVKDFCETVPARDMSYLICKLIMMYCIVGLRTSLLLPILLCICQIFFLSIVWMIKIFVKDFCETVQARVVIFDMQFDNDVLYRGIANQPSPAYSSLYLSNFLSFHTLDDKNFRQRFL